MVLSSFLLVFLVTSFGDVFPLRLSDGDAELSGKMAWH